MRPNHVGPSLFAHLLGAQPATPMQRTAIGMALATAFAATYFMLGRIQFFHWNITNGLLFAALWLLPLRWWPWLFVATVVARSLGGVVVHGASGMPGGFLGYWANPAQYILGNLLEPFLIATGVLLLGRLGVDPRSRATGSAIGLLHLAAATSALAVAGKDVLYVLNDGYIGDVRRSLIVDPVPIGGPGSWTLLAGFAIKNALGNFIGIMLVAPLTWWSCSAAARTGSRAIAQAAARYLLPGMTIYLLLVQASPQSQMAELLRLLLMAAVVVFAMRHGWRGAAAAVLAVSMAVAIEDHVGQPAVHPVWMQLFIAICGAMALMFGAAVDELRDQRHQLTRAHARSTGLAEELSLAAQRNLQAEERERRRLAAELHDEFGQNLTALQTHLKLAQPAFDSLDRRHVIDTLLGITRAMRQNIGEVLESLRPAALDEIGLYAMIEHGSIRRLAEDAGLEFSSMIEGDARLLPLLGEAQRIAAYRLAQEAVTNVVRHAHASRCNVRLRISRRNGNLCVFLDVRDDGIGGARHLQPGNGLTSMRDRVLALGGRLHLRDLDPGLRVHALLRDERATRFA
jgi:two-component system sensor histidine kinase UhpB